MPPPTPLSAPTGCSSTGRRPAPSSGQPARARVVVTFPMMGPASEVLAAALGQDFVVLDVRTAPAESEVVLCRPCSPGAIASLRRAFPRASILVAETPQSLGSVSLTGPVARMRDAGADVYMSGASLRLVASAIRERVGLAAVDGTLVSCRRPAGSRHPARSGTHAA